jgi:hypothetical protein
MPNGFKYLSKVNEYYCAAKSGEFASTTITYVNQCGLTSTIVCPVPPSVSLSFFAFSFTINTAYNKSDITLVQSDALVNQASSGSDFGMDNNTIKDDIIVYAINNRAYGPTNVTGYYAGIDPPSSGYTVYSLRNCTPTYNVQVATNDATLIGIANSYGASATTIYDALNWANTTRWISVVNKNYPNIYTDYLYFCIDPTFTISYPKGGSDAYSIASYPNWSGATTTASEGGSGWSWGSTVGGGSWTPNGDDGYWQCVTDFQATSEFTIDIWYRSIAQDSGNILFQTDQYGNTPNGVQIVVNTSTQLYINLYENSNLRSQVFSTNTLTANTFCNIVLTYNTNDGFRLYINNTLIGNVDNYKVDYTNNSFLYGGDGQSGQVKGYLSTLKLYYKDLSKISGALTQNYTNYQIT